MLGNFLEEIYACADRRVFSHKMPNQENKPVSRYLILLTERYHLTSVPEKSEDISLAISRSQGSGILFVRVNRFLDRLPLSGLSLAYENPVTVSARVLALFCIASL